MPDPNLSNGPEAVTDGCETLDQDAFLKKFPEHKDSISTLDIPAERRSYEVGKCESNFLLSVPNCDEAVAVQSTIQIDQTRFHIVELSTQVVNLIEGSAVYRIGVSDCSPEEEIADNANRTEIEALLQEAKAKNVPTLQLIQAQSLFLDPIANNLTLFDLKIDAVQSTDGVLYNLALYVKDGGVEVVDKTHSQRLSVGEKNFVGAGEFVEFNPRAIFNENRSVNKLLGDVLDGDMVTTDDSDISSSSTSNNHNFAGCSLARTSMGVRPENISAEIISLLASVMAAMAIRSMHGKMMREFRAMLLKTFKGIAEMFRNQ